MNNIRLAFILNFLRYSWFWLGIWLFYYLRYTDYVGVAIIEIVQITVNVLAEIPTGAIADLLGKKKTLMISFALLAIGNFWMAAGINIYHLVGSVFVMSLGYTFFSGTFDALVYDTLLEQKQESQFEKIISRINIAPHIAAGTSGIIGGFIYLYNPHLPFIMVGICALIGLVLCFFLHEPAVDSNKFSLANFLTQLKQGFNQLTKTSEAKNTVWFLLITTFCGVIMYELLHDAQAIEYGFTPETMGILAALMYAASAIGSYITPSLRGKYSYFQIVLLISLLYGLTLLVSPYLGLIAGAIVIIGRHMSTSINNNLNSAIINKLVSSEYRATTLSTFSMIANIPYIFVAVFLGSAINMYTANNVAVILGILMLIGACYQLYQIKSHKI
ncbi:MAG: MFS transporter [Weeksellaceae bacterium]